MPLRLALVLVAGLAQTTVNPWVIGSRSGALTYAEVVLRDGPLGYWRLGEPSGTTLTDSSTYARANGTYTGTFTLAQLAGTVDGDTAAYFDGVTGRASSGLDLLSNGTAVTMEAWVNHQGQTWNAGAHEIVQDWGTAGHYIGALPTGRAAMSLRISMTQRTAAAASPLPTTGWHHIVGTWTSGDYQRLYINGGLLVASATPYTGTLDALNAGTLHVGAFGGSLFFKGLIDEVAVYGYALTPQQVADHYAARQVQVRR